MSTLWTPGGENDPEEPESTAATADAGVGGPEDEAAREQLRALREQLAQTPVADIVANHAIGLWQLALLHLSAEEGTEPDLEEARLAIDGVAALVEGLEGRSAGTRSRSAKRWRSCVSRSSRSAGAPSQVTTKQATRADSVTRQ